MQNEPFCLYPYITDNNLEYKQNYMYSKYAGKDFLQVYIKTRKIKYYPKDNLAEDWDPIEMSAVYHELAWICEGLESGENHQGALKLLKGYVKSFEVRKRLYTAYQDWRPVQDASFEEYESYLLFADCLLQAYALTKNLKYFSCLLKLDDTLLSIQERLNLRQQKHLQVIICQELERVSELLQVHGIYLEESQ